MIKRFPWYVCIAGFFTCSAIVAWAEEAPAEVGFEVPFTVQQGKVQSQLRIAVTDLEKAQGLMGVSSLPENQGMIFIYPEDRQMSFWMKNTLLDLDIAFVRADGVVDEIKSMYAQDKTTVNSQSSRIRYAVEMPLGWYAQKGVRVGDQLKMGDLKQALLARGFRAERYLP